MQSPFYALIVQPFWGRVKIWSAPYFHLFGSAHTWPLYATQPQTGTYGALNEYLHEGFDHTWATLGWGQACVIGIIPGFGVCTGCG